MGEGLFFCGSQVLEFPPTGGQTGSNFAGLRQAGKLSLDDWLPELGLKWIIVNYCFEFFSFWYGFYLPFLRVACV